jgi:phosphoribosylaminoimidazole carboxylase PurE protein
MQEGAELLASLSIPFEMTALSPYRVPDQVREYGVSAESRGFEVVMAGSGGTNELACMIACYTTMPVIGIPLREEEDMSVSKELAALLSTLETPPGIPVATVGFNDVVNAAVLAAEILGVKDRRVRAKLVDYRRHRREEAHQKALNVQQVALDIMERLQQI